MSFSEWIVETNPEKKEVEKKVQVAPQGVVSLKRILLLHMA